MSWKSQLGAVACAAALCPSLAACGGSSSTLSRSQLVAKANAICNTAVNEGRTIPVPQDLVTNAAAAAAYFDKVTPIVDKETADLGALKPDSSAAADWNAFVSVRKSTDQTIDTIKQKADAHDRSGIALLRSLAGPATQLRARVSLSSVKAFPTTSNGSPWTQVTPSVGERPSL